MKSDFLTKQLVGIGGSLLVTIVLVAGFSAATSPAQLHAANAESARMSSSVETITVTATRLGTNHLATANQICQAAVC